MARIISCSARVTQPLAEGWECLRTSADAAACPSDLGDDGTWYPASVPGTFAAALREAGQWNGEPPLELDDDDVWYRTRFFGTGRETLCFAGLATISDIWMNGAHVLHTDNMFRPYAIEIDARGENELYICFRSLRAWLRRQRGRARWRTRLAVPSSLRFARTTLLGRMPGWCPAVHPVGPWQPVWRERWNGPFRLRGVDARATFADGDGKLALCCELGGDVPEDLQGCIEIGGHTGRLEQVAPDRLAGALSLPGIAHWWPHTHGEPALHQARLRIGDIVCDLGPVGFRSIAVDRGADGNGFGLRVNGEAVFCRGACWTTPDLVTLAADTASCRALLEDMRNAGLNTVRIAGTMVYGSDDFYALCDELGLLVWQDVMLASFDYPATPEFRSSLTAELDAFVARTQLNVSLAVFCGGSEVLQQAAMFGLARDRIDDSLYSSVIPDTIGARRGDVVYVANSPSGGDLPFQPNKGVTHYYGVGAYLRPLHDARESDVRFASECLALANVPCRRTFEAMRVAGITEPGWKRGVPRDPGAAWDFDDVRDDYLATLFGIDPLRVRYADFERYLELSRAVSCVLMEQVVSEWRRLGSGCRGGLVWQWQDVALGAGWGIIDSVHRRKPAWHALQRACRPRQLIVTDEGLNGLALHVLNERETALHAVLRIECLQDGATVVRQAQCPVDLAPRSGLCLDAASLLPEFFDITYAYRFGPPAHDVTIATLSDSVSGELIADAFHFPDVAAVQPREIGLEVAVDRDSHGWYLRLLSHRLARYLHIDDASFMPQEDWLHLPPGRPRRIALQPAKDDAHAIPRGEVRALNMMRAVPYAGHAPRPD
ncbi:MAG TPA: glycoside hydrolase family 2 protein [Acetobacteraceae bacterium]